MFDRMRARALNNGFKSISTTVAAASAEGKKQLLPLFSEQFTVSDFMQTTINKLRD